MASNREKPPRFLRRTPSSRPVGGGHGDCPGGGDGFNAFVGDGKSYKPVTYFMKVITMHNWLAKSNMQAMYAFGVRFLSNR